MANVYAPSDKITIYPSSLRSTDSSHYGDNFPSEHNIGKIGNQLVDRNIKGYIITTNVDDENSGWKDGTFEFNIGGYNVQIENVKETIESIINSTDDADLERLCENFITFTVADNIVYANISIYQLIISSTESADKTPNESAYNFLYGIDYDSSSIDSKLESIYPKSEYEEVESISLPILCVDGVEGDWEVTDIYRDSYLKLIKLENINIDEGIIASDGDFIVSKDEVTTLSINGEIISTGDISTNSNLIVDKDISASDNTINITDNKIVIGKDTVTTVIENNTIVLENTDITSKVEIDYNGKITTTGMIHAEGDIETDSNLSIMGSANFENNSVKIDINKITVGTGSSVTTINSGDITADGNVGIYGGITADNGNFKVDTDGIVTIGAPDKCTIVEGDEITTNKLQINTSIDVGNSNVTRLTSTKMKSGTVKGTTAIIGGTVSGTTFTASNGINVNGGNIVVSSGDMTANNITANGTLSVEKSMDIYGAVNCESSFSCVDITTSKGIISKGDVDIVSQTVTIADDDDNESTEITGGNLTIDKTLSVGKASNGYNFNVANDGTITAPTLNGNATSANKVNSKLKLTINNVDPQEYDGSEAKDISFYAPTSAGTYGQYLMSNGLGNGPSWSTLISNETQVDTSDASKAAVITYAWNYTGNQKTDITTDTKVYYVDIGIFRILKVQYVGGMIYNGQGHGFGVYVGKMFNPGGVYSATAIPLNGNSYHDSNNSIGMSFGCFIGSSATSTSVNGKTDDSFAKEMIGDDRFTSTGDWVEFTDPVDRTTSSGGFNGLYVTVIGIAKS